MSWRISTRFIDNTETVQTTLPVFGATAIVAPKGSGSFYFFEKGSTQKILDTYGYPSSSYPSIQDAIDANLKAGLWISAPSKTGKYGGVFVLKTGTIPFVSGTAGKTITDYSAVPSASTVETADGVKVTFTYTLPNFAHYKPESLDILVNGASLTPAFASALGVETITTTPDVGGGTLTLATGVLSFTFDAAPDEGDVLSVTYDLDIEADVYATLFSHSPQADDLQVKVIKSTTTTGALELSVTRYNPIEKTYFEISGSPFTVSLDPLGKDGYGNNIFIENVFEESSQTILTAEVVNETLTTLTDGTAYVSLAGGSRGAAIAGADLATAYGILEDKVQYPAKVIFDGSGLAEVATKFEQLREGNLNRVRFMLPTANLSATALIADPLVAANSTTNRGLYYYCLTWGIHKDLYQGRNFACSNMGLIAGKMLDVLILGPGGVPAWIDENGVGGQLGGAITKFNFNATESQLQLLDQARLNPVVSDPVYGPMIKSWRTRQSTLSDYAYIGQSSLADWIVELIETQVLPLQLGKTIDDFHMGQVKGKCESVLNSVSNWLEDFYVLCDRTNNTADTLQQQKFILTCAVKFTPYSNTIEFNFVATPQGVTVEEYIKKQ
jgi:hypothetical protein